MATLFANNSTKEFSKSKFSPYRLTKYSIGLLKLTLYRTPVRRTWLSIIRPYLLCSSDDLIVFPAVISHPKEDGQGGLIRSWLASRQLEWYRDEEFFRLRNGSNQQLWKEENTSVMMTYISLFLFLGVHACGSAGLRLPMMTFITIPNTRTRNGLES